MRAGYSRLRARRRGGCACPAAVASRCAGGAFCPGRATAALRTWFVARGDQVLHRLPRQRRSAVGDPQLPRGREMVHVDRVEVPGDRVLEPRAEGVPYLGEGRASDQMEPEGGAHHPARAPGLELPGGGLEGRYELAGRGGGEIASARL